MTGPGTFEIRIICAPADADRITAALAAAFTTGPVRRYPTRDHRQVRLYITATDRAPAPVLRLLRPDH
ncbi:hypothetical protein HHX38_02595 [Streptomyces sp. PKU-MA01144]|uniref:hypothetical protein n=1 Tax=Streptomyces sp. PKU-MA01144 TaxID=2729138 RepID=UPI00147B4CD1|nr:hypothetical protein [Streptomyces sp. PKU-MA01144]NNJ03034.1 hypothetical protein [Streptomyces sp. PKU-MA01144]